jgi:hypothetical protein
MSRGNSSFRQADVTRAVKGLVAAGFEVARVEVDKDGKIIVVPGKPAASMDDKAMGPWDKAVAELEAKR